MRGHLVDGIRLFATLGVVSVCAACGGSGESETKDAAQSPVIAVHDWNGYPTAEVSGLLRLIDGCLLVGDSVAFWAEGASWDATTQSVVFEAADPVHVGEEFSGGGGYFNRDNLEDLNGLDVDSVIECLDRTDSVESVIATPPD